MAHAHGIEPLIGAEGEFFAPGAAEVLERHAELLGFVFETDGLVEFVGDGVGQLAEGVAAGYGNVFGERSGFVVGDGKQAEHVIIKCGCAGGI